MINRRGSTTVELAIIFPVIIYIIFIIIHLGIIIYQKAYIQSVCNQILESSAYNFYNDGADMSTGQINYENIKTENIYASLYDINEKDKIRKIKNQIEDEIYYNGIIRPSLLVQKVEVKNILLFKRLVATIEVEYSSPLNPVLKIFGIDGTYKLVVSSNNLIKDYQSYVNDLDYVFEIFEDITQKFEILKKIYSAMDEIKKRLIY